MPRVVCPICQTGFEASISRGNVAVNCVACGVAFNAAAFLSRDDFAAGADKRSSSIARAVTERAAPAEKKISSVQKVPEFAEPASDATRTCGLPFMQDGELIPRSKPPAAASTPLPRIDRPVPARASTASKLDVSADECPVATMEPPASVPTPVPIAVAPAAALPAPKIEKAAEKPRKGSRRPLLEGTFGPYEIIGEIARGGVGAVFRAKEKETGRDVALKVLLEGSDAGECERERFQHECETAKALSLPGMVQVYAVGELEGRPYMAMELVNGRSLDRVIPEKSLSVNDCLVLMKSIAETIGALHEAGYVHRDIKPGNILIDAFGSPKVADFGLVKSLDEITRLTASGLVCGTPAYMSPEQARGDGKNIDPRSDVWALGAVLYEMLTSRPPFQAENALRLMLKITKDQPTPPRVLNLKVPQDVHCIVMKCLEKNAERRYPNARAMAEDISRFLNGQPIEIGTQPGERVQQLFTHVAKHGMLLTGVAGAVVAGLVLTVIVRSVFSPREAGPVVMQAYATLGDNALGKDARLDKAEGLFRNAIEIDARNGRAHLGLGLCTAGRAIDPATNRLLDMKKFADARALTAQAAQVDKTLNGEAHAQLARFNMWLKQHVAEAREREQAVAAAPTNLKYREDLAMAYWNAGAQTNQRDYYNAAVQEFRGIMQQNPEWPRVREYIKVLQERFLTQSALQTTMAPRSRR